MSVQNQVSETFDALIAKHEAFWVERLAMLQPITVPYADRTASHLNQKPYTSVKISVPHEVTTFLEERQSEWNQGEFLFAAFATYLVRIGGTGCFDIGFRDVELQRELIGLEGFFASIVPCRVDINYEQSFEEVFEAFRKQVELTKLHKTYARDVVARYPALRSLPELSREPMFPVVVERVEKLDDHQAGSGNDLTLVIPSEGKECCWLYNTEALDGDSIARMLDQFTTFLQGIVTDPEGRVAYLPLLSELERHKILVEWNDTQADYPKDKCIHQLFEEQVERTPDAVAVVYEDKQLTYRELNARANQLAHYLQKLGVGPEVLVGIFVERSLEMMVGLLGILKAGGGYVPLDPAYPFERLGFMLEDSSVPVLLSQSKLVEKLPPHSARLVNLDNDWEEIVQQSKDNPSSVTPDNLAYVIYTSGSTGKPKGVLIQHGSLVNYTTAASAEYRISECDRILQFASISFDASAEEIYPCLTSGATLILRTDSMLDSVDRFLQKCRTWNLTVLSLPTAYWHELTAILSKETLALPPSLRLVIIGGEKALPKRWETWLEYVGQRVRLVNTYGPTEATVVATICELSTADLSSTELPIGRPISNLQTYILDRYQQPVPIGVPGELHIGGDGLARGYLNRPDLTDEKFIPNHFSNEPGSRLYKTGDLVRYLPDGNIEFLGRIDNQVKIRGFRIELGEIETAISQHPSVKETAVIATENLAGNKQLVAYIIPQPEAAPSPSDLRHFLKEQLPDYMIPSVFVTLDKFPLSPNGKIDRRALPSPEIRPEKELTFVAPRTPIEEILANIWSDVLGIQQKIGISDNFLELGGHSLLAIQVISRVRDTLGVDLSLRCLLEAPTVAELAQHMETVGEQNPKLIFPPIQPVARTQNLPLSFGQEQLWILHQLASDTPVYNEPSTIRLPGNVNVAALEKALNEIVKRHEILRTTYKMVDGQPMQAIAPSLSLPLPVVDLRSLPTSEREAEALRLATQEARQPFDLTSGPLLRATLMRLDETDYRLFLAAHHIVDDGISSYSVFLPELQTLYQAFCAGFPSPLKELPIQYADFAVWQRQWLQSEVLEPQLAYWKQQLADLPVLQLPTDRPRTARQSFRGSRQCLALSRNLTDELLALSRREGVTLFMTLLAAFKTLLYRYTGADDIPVGTVTGSRNRPELEGSIGFFLNTLVLRTDLSGNPSFLKLLERVREVTLEADAHRDLPFEHLVQTLQPERSSSQNPLFQVSFVLEPPMPALDSGWNMSQLDVVTGTTKFDLTLELDERPEGIIGRIEYSTDLFESSTISRMIGHFQALLEGIVANPQARISNLPLLTETERHQLRVDWNNTTTDYPQDKCIHQLFEEQVERIPSCVAVVFEGEQLTYRELNARANQLAHHLQKLGVEPEMLVGICVERSLEMIVGLLGILKAGGAYLPLDPSYPQDRLGLMLEDAQVSVLLTQQKLVAGFSEYKAQRFCLDTDWEVIAQESEEKPVSSVTADNLAYTIYTSGSTGKPKGVLVTHQNLVHSTSARISYYSEPVTSFFLLSSFGFDSSIAGIFWTLCQGGLLVLPPDKFQQELLQLTKFIAQHQISHLLSLPSLYSLILEQAEPQQLTCLRTVIVAGEPCSRELIERHSKQLAHTSLFNEYGPTEGTVWSSVYHCQPSGLRTQVPIGRPITNMQIYLLDKYLSPVPIGVPGEIHIGGAGIARGYLNRPELTNQKFIPNPFSDEPGQRLYKTGDLARYLSDGNIEFLGRLDEQVKIRGFRIELGEIEALLAQHPDLREVVVVVREDIPGNKYLAAYVVPKLEASPPPINALHSFLKAKLPDYMVPGTFVFLEAMPLTPNGKIDRRALPVPASSRREQEDNFVVPSTPTEEILAAIWAEVLGLQQVGINDNFFELGGHSLLAARLFAQIEKKLGRNLPLANLFQAPTIKELASLFNQEDHSSEHQKSTTPLESATNLLNQSGSPLPRSSLIVIQPKGSKPPLFCIHVLGRGLKFYRPLAHHLGLEQPLYGLAAQIMDRKYAPPNRVEDLAAHYIKEMQILQPHGPYFLAGVSFGGSVAFEMAQQLVAQGQKVALLALFDTYASEAVKKMPSGERFSAHWNNFLKLGPIFVLKKVKAKIQSFNDKLNHSLNEIGCKFYLGIGRPLPNNLQDFTFRKENNQASRNYVPQVYPGRVTLFRSRDHIIDVSSYRDPQLGWGELAAGGLEFHEVPGTHLGMLQEPHVQLLAEKLKDCLDKAQAETHL